MSNFRGGEGSVSLILRRYLSTIALIILLIFAALVAAGCGDSAEADTGPAVLHITAGRDPTGLEPKILKQCTAQSKGAYRLEELILPPSVDAQREQIIRRLAGEDDSLDILGMDVIWTAEFSEAGWLLDLSSRVEPIKNDYVSAPLSTVLHNKKYWALPFETNVAMLYYRKDLIKTPPKTWEELAKVGKEVADKNSGMDAFLWQAAQYEGGTVDAMEFILSAGGGVLNEDGSKSILADGDGAVRAFTFMNKLIKDGVSPRTVTTFHEEESRIAFQSGKAVFLRNWPYVWPLSQTDPGSKVKGKVGVAPLPGFEGHAPATVLGGKNLAISRFTKHPEKAWDAIQCITSAQNQRRLLEVKGNLPALQELYEVDELKKKIPYLETAREALDVAHPRPISPYYNDITIALARAANEATSGVTSPEDAVKKADKAIQSGVDGEGEI